MKLKDGYKKLIGTSYNGDASLVLLSNGGNLGYAISSTASTLVLRNTNGLIESSIATSANLSPFKITSTYLNTNLNADLLDNYQANTLLEEFTSTAAKNLHLKIGGKEIDINDIYATFDAEGNNIVAKYVTLDTAQTISGVKTFSSLQKFTYAGAPFTVSNSTVVVNLNADLLDGVHKEGLLTTFENINDTDHPLSIKLTVGGTTKYVLTAYSINANLAGILGNSTNANYPLLFTSAVNTSTTNRAYLNIYTDTANSLYYNPSTNTLRTVNLYVAGTSTFCADVTLYKSDSGDSPRLIFLRSELNQTSYIDWSIYDTTGDLVFLKSAGNGWEDVFRIDYDTNATTVVGNSNAAAFVLTGTGISDFSAGTIKFDTINIPTTSGGTTYGAGTSGQVLKSNGTTVYWASDNNSDTWRPVSVNGTSVATSTTGTGTLNIVLGTGITVSGAVNSLTITNAGVRSVTIGTSANADKLAVNTNGSTSYLTIPYATKSKQDVDGNDFKTTYLRKVSVANNTTNDFNTFENMTLTGRGDPATGASLSNAPWSGTGPAGGYGVLTYLWSGYGTQMAWGYHSNRIYIRNKYYTNSAATWSSTWDSLALISDIPTVTNYYWADLNISSSSNAATSPTVALLKATTGVQIGSTADYGWYLSSSRICAGSTTARGVNVGSLLVSNAWADYTKVPTNGIYSKGNIQTAGGFIKSNSSDSYVLLGGGGHKALSDFAMSSDYVKKAGDTMTGRLVMNNAGIIVTTATTSNYRVGVEFYKGTAQDATYSYDAQIGWHNTGGDGTGSICILPYATSTLPWGGSVGLFITKTELKYNNNNLLKAIKSITRSGTTFTYTCIDGTTGTFTLLDNNTTYAVYGKTIDASYKTAYRTQTGRASGYYLAAIRCDTASVAEAPLYGSGIAFGMADTHGYLYMNYSSAYAYIGAGNADKLNWTATLLHSGNSSVSGGGSTWGSSITVKINGTSKTLTIPSKPALSVTTSGSGNAVTAVSVSDHAITVTKGSTFSTSGHTHYYLVTPGDLRSTATTPNSYSNKFIFLGLKTNTTINSPSSDTYSYLFGLRGWSDSSGGNSWELAFNNTGIYARNGATTSWGSWRTIIDSGNYSSYLGYVGTTAVQSSSATQALTGISRISNSTSAALYLGNSGNQSWVYTQDIASHSGTNYWAINIAGTAWFKNVHIGYTYNTTSGYNLGVTGTGYISSTLTMGGVINTASTPGTWVSGMSGAAILYGGLAAINDSSFWRFFNMKSSGGHVVCYGGLGNDIGFYGYYSGRTANGTDWRFTVSTANGNWTATASIYAAHFYENSDIMLKTNILEILRSDNIPTIKEFDWKENGSHSYGLIAQELEELGYSELVSVRDDGYKTVNYSAALSLIVGKLQVKIKELEKEIEILKNKN